jgi:hypothetical protein
VSGAAGGTAQSWTEDIQAGLSKEAFVATGVALAIGLV